MKPPIHYKSYRIIIIYSASEVKGIFKWIKSLSKAEIHSRKIKKDEDVVIPFRVEVSP